MHYKLNVSGLEPEGCCSGSCYASKVEVVIVTVSQAVKTPKTTVNLSSKECRLCWACLQVLLRSLRWKQVTDVAPPAPANAVPAEALNGKGCER